jgi:hypothetical protein
MMTAPRSARKWLRMLLALGVVCIVSVLSELRGGYEDALFVMGVSGGNSWGELLGETS